MPAQSDKPQYLDHTQPVDARVKDLIGRMTLAEKASQMANTSPAIARLGIPGYDWWSECLHGVARAGRATVFPQAIGLATTWNTDLMLDIATAISDEARAKYHEFVKHEDRGCCKGLTFWSPNINILRDPRWGRGQETYGEDPFLTARMGVAFVKGLQGDHPHYLKLVATPKHYAVHSGPEGERHTMNAESTEQDLRETYLPAFEACVREADAKSIMGAYNRTNGEACCASKRLLVDILRTEWGFDGYVVSDCGAIFDIYRRHRIVDTPEEAAALAVNNGCELNCGIVYPALVTAVKQGLIAEEKVDEAVGKLFEMRFKLGMFDADEHVPYASIPYSVVNCEKHRKLALEAAHQSIVVLKNENNLLPLDKSQIQSLAVIGPNAESYDALVGNYNGRPSNCWTALRGIYDHVSPEIDVHYALGAELKKESEEHIADAVSLAEHTDVAIVILGITAKLEGEEGCVNADCKGDRFTLDLPGKQQILLKAIHATGTPTILVTMSGSALAINWADKNIPAILHAWYPGEAGGKALADVLFGDYAPSGRLPVTFYKSHDDLPPFTDYRMDNRTYKFFDGDVLYPFGYGLTYSTFEYSGVAADKHEFAAHEPISVSCKVKNTGTIDSGEVVQCYIRDLQASTRVPKCKLVGFKRLQLAAGEEQEVRFAIGVKELALIDERGRAVVEPGEFEISIGGGQPYRDESNCVSVLVVATA
ncbi:MAG: glycoside hydrolase family 3 protein [Chitinivibrionales bacterium]|nr:glycoside hydrolase family 3 protein [Chitinivibrionales bacterium]